MSDTDSFIDEVTEEVRRDQLYGYLRRYGWIAALIIVAIVAGAAWNEYRKAQSESAAEAVGDAMIAALSEDDAAGRSASLAEVAPTTPGNTAVQQFLLAAESANADKIEEAVAGLNSIAADGELPQIYRDIAAFKALLIQSETLPVEDRQLQFEAQAEPGKPLRLLAEEQMALIEISQGESEAALMRLQAILQDAEITPALQERASQLIVALGGTPDILQQSQG